MILRGFSRPRVEEEGVRGDMFFEVYLCLDLSTMVVRRAEEYSAIIKLRNTKCGGLPIYTNGALADRVTKYHSTWKLLP